MEEIAIVAKSRGHGDIGSPYALFLTGS